MTHRLRRLGAALSAICLLAALASCASTAQGTSSDMVLHWYTGPDRADTAALAKRCTREAAGEYSITVESLPQGQAERRAVLLKRLLGDDSSMDIISMDDAFTAEFADAQVLAPVPDNLKESITDDAFEVGVDAATYDGNLVAAPWWLDPVMLWYRPSAAERAGLSMDETLGWNELIDGAGRIESRIEIDDARGEGIVPLVRGIIAQSGGQVVNGSSRDSTVGLSSEAGRTAAVTLQKYYRGGLGDGPSPNAAEHFAGTNGGFMLAPVGAISDPALKTISADIDWAPMPMDSSGDDTAGDDEPIAPLSGYHLAVPLYAQHSPESFEAIECLTSPGPMAEMMTDSGHSAVSSAAYEEAGDDYPWSDVTRDAMKNGVVADQTPYWHLIVEGIETTWQPLAAVNSATPKTAQERVTALLAGDRP